jgi:hypothetical protein
MLVVGGFLEHHNFDLISRSHTRFISDRGLCFLAIEIQNANTFGHMDLYCRGCRGIQSFMALYANFRPTLLLSQHNFKLLVANPDRTQIFTYPYRITPDTEEENTSYHHSAAIANMNPDLIKIIVIALLAGRLSRCRL